MSIRKIERKVGETVSPEMMQEAKNLRNLATLIEGGTAIAVAYAWVQKDKDVAVPYSTFCGDDCGMVLLAAVVLLQRKISNGLVENERT